MFLLLLSACDRLPSPVSHETAVGSDDTGAPAPDETGAEGETAAPPTPVWTVAVEAADAWLVADGVDHTALTLTVTDAYGAPAPDGTVLAIGSDIGHVEALSPVTGGRATASFRAGTWPGRATLSAEGAVLTGQTAVDLGAGTPTSVQLHLHGSISEGNATMLDHVDGAEATGVDVLWYSDHDYLYYPDHSYEMTGDGFESGSLGVSLPGFPSTTTNDVVWAELPGSTLRAARAEVIAGAARTGAYGLHLEGWSTGTEPASATWKTSIARTLNFKSLFGDVRLRFAFRPLHSFEDAELFVTVPLSAVRSGSDVVQEGSRAIHFYHSAHDYTSLSSPTELYVPIRGRIGEWTAVDVNLSELAESRFREGLDLHAELASLTVRAWNGATVRYDLDDIQWTQARVGEELRDAQRDYLGSLATPVLHFVGQELSMLQEGHFNAFGGDVGFLPYAADDALDAWAAVEHTHTAGGLVSYNHMFGTGVARWSDVERAAAVSERLEALLANGVWGCDLLEVGYRQRLGLIEDFLQIWDGLSVAGIWITGEGASDLHNQADWWTLDNDFVTWVPVEYATEDELLRALKRGMAWFGDPSLFPRGSSVSVGLQAPEVQATMGQVVVGRTEPVTIDFTAEPLKEGWIVRAVEDGEVTEQWPVTAAGPFAASRTIDPAGGRFIRFEVLRDETPVLYTNPIYFVDEGEPPPERIPAP